jgi:hypothetical protein
MRTPEIIVTTDMDFAILRGERPVGSARWADVVEIRAYKRDELTTDLLCLDVQVKDGTTWLVHEEAPGWEEFLEEAERALPGVRPFREWFAEVTQPALARNEKLIFKRA